MPSVSPVHQGAPSHQAQLSAGQHAAPLSPTLSPQQLRDVLQSAPEQALAVAVHPNADEVLRAWLWQAGEGELRLAMYKHYLAARDRIAATGAALPQAAAEFDGAVGKAYAMWQEGLAQPSADDLTRTSTSGDAAGEAYSGVAERMPASPQIAAVPQAAAPAHGMPQTPLAMLQLPDGRQKPLLADLVLVGRKPDVGQYPGAQVISAPDDRLLLSSTHAMLRLHEGYWYVTDLGSTNGTIVGNDLGARRLESGETQNFTSGLLLGGLQFWLAAAPEVTR